LVASNANYTTEKLYVELSGSDPETAFNNIASFISEFQPQNQTKSVLNSTSIGWASWIPWSKNINETKIITALNYMYANFSNCKLIQIDDGWQQEYGDWYNNSAFPSGMAWLANQIKGKNMNAGLWVAPWLVSNESSVYANHKVLCQPANSYEGLVEFVGDPGSHLTEGPQTIRAHTQDALPFRFLFSRPPGFLLLALSDIADDSCEEHFPSCLPGREGKLYGEFAAVLSEANSLDCSSDDI